MRRQDVTFRITKINKRAVAVAICALTGSTLSVTSHADQFLGSTFPSSVTIGLGDTQKSGDRFYGDISSAACGGVALSPASVDVGAPTNCSPTSGVLDNTTFITRSSVVKPNEFGQVIGSETHHFGLGVSVGAINPGTPGQVITLLASPPVLVSLEPGSASGPAGPDNVGVAIRLSAGEANFYGGNKVTGSTQAATINVLGANVEFNGNVTGDVSLFSTGTVFRDTVNGDINIQTGAGATLDRNANLTGNLNFLSNNGVFTFAGGNAVTGNVVATGVNSSVKFSGSAMVTGAMGAAGSPNAPIGAVMVDASGAFVRLNTNSGDTVVGELAINAPQAVVQVNGRLIGNVNVNGQASRLDLLNRSSAPADVANAGMRGTLDFGTVGAGSLAVGGSGSLRVGDNVDLSVGSDPGTQLSISNANNATLIFSGNSTVSGQLGTARSEADAFNRIWAGADSSVVTFANDVYLANPPGAPQAYEGQLRTGGGTVNLQGSLFGDLVIGSDNASPRPLAVANYAGYGDSSAVGTFSNNGTVNIADGKTVSGSITTNQTGTGTLNFLGSSNYAGLTATQPGQIGTVADKLSSVAFNSETAKATTTIRNHVYANQVAIGSGSNETTAILIRSGEVGDTTRMILGDNLALANANTTLNLDSTFGTSGTAPALLNFAKDAATGRLSNQNTVRAQTGNLVTNGATMNFVVDAGATESPTGNIAAETSSQLQTTNITVDNQEKYNIVYLGSVRNDQAFSLVTGTSTDLSELDEQSLIGESRRLRDNSYILNSKIRNGSIELLVSRSADEYIEKSNTRGEISNPAALRLGQMGALGSDTPTPAYSSDIQLVFNQLDIDQWGFGNNEANLATQVRRLIPVVNGSDLYSALSATSAALSAAGERLAVLRGDSPMGGLDGNGRSLGSNQTGWVKVLGGSGKGKSIDGYDGFKTDLYGLSLGLDTLISNGVLGLMGHVSKSTIKQENFRAGDSADLESLGMGIYATQEYGPVYVEASLLFSNHQLDGRRAAAINRVANSKVDYKHSSARFSTGYRIALDPNGRSVITPLLAIEYGKINQPAYMETNAGDLGLAVDSRVIKLTRGSIGFRLSTEVETSLGVFYPDLYAVYNTTSGLTNAETSVVASYIGDYDKQRFTTLGVTPKKNSYTVAGGLRYATGRHSELQLGYRFDGGQNLQSHQTSVRAAWAF